MAATTNREWCSPDGAIRDIAVRRIEAELRQPRLFPAAPVERQATMFEEVQ